MITRYQIVDPTGKVIDELNSQEEVNLYVATKRDQDPHFQFEVIPEVAEEFNRIGEFQASSSME